MSQMTSCSGLSLLLAWLVKAVLWHCLKWSKILRLVWVISPLPVTSQTIEPLTRLRRKHYTLSWWTVNTVSLERGRVSLYVTTLHCPSSVVVGPIVVLLSRHIKTSSPISELKTLKVLWLGFMPAQLLSQTVLKMKWRSEWPLTVHLSTLIHTSMKKSMRTTTLRRLKNWASGLKLSSRMMALTRYPMPSKLKPMSLMGKLSILETQSTSRVESTGLMSIRRLSPMSSTLWQKSISP